MTYKTWLLEETCTKMVKSKFEITKFDPNNTKSKTRGKRKEWMYTSYIVINKIKEAQPVLPADSQYFQGLKNIDYRQVKTVGLLLLY